MVYIMSGMDFVEMFKPGGIRDKYYIKRYGRRLPVPLTMGLITVFNGRDKKYVTSGRIFTHKENGIVKDDCGRVSVCVNDQEDIPYEKKLSIEDTLNYLNIHYGLK